jgi:hypothetical protein
MTMRRWRGLWILVGIVAALAIAIPVMGANPSPAASPSGGATPAATAEPDETGEPDGSSKPDKPGKPDLAAKPDKGPEVTVTVQGTVQQSTDAKGRPAFTLTAGGKTWELSAGPPWFWGDKNPLTASVGKSVSIVGTAEAGGTELDVTSVDGKAIRAAGKPPWAGGPWVIGPTHPGWKPWMANGKPGKDKTNTTTPEKPG